ncbi:putative transposase [Escherichia coli]|uniref:Putative transposase n=1 Tax=Escherichia coli TaxID=562 RepID=A0A447XEF4_ECOLX|nr:putative transposase [Escherichia coli]
MMIYWRDFSANDTVSVSWLCTLFLRQVSTQTIRQSDDRSVREAFGSAAAKLECEIIEMDGEPDHVHLLVAYPPKLAVSVMVNNLKSVSSRLLRQQNAHLRMQSKTGFCGRDRTLSVAPEGQRLKRSEPTFRVSQHLIDL